MLFKVSFTVMFYDYSLCIIHFVLFMAHKSTLILRSIAVTLQSTEDGQDKVV